MVAVKALLTAAILALPFSGASHIHAQRHDHATNKALPGTWHHDDTHPVHDLFRRGADDTFAPIGSPSWSANFPQSTPDPNKLPKPWVDALNAAVAAGKIPNIPQTTSVSQGPPQYPPGYDPNSPQVCSAYYRNCRNKDDIWDAPDGYIGTSFDDGPLPDQVTLNKFLADNNEKTTHFLIGVYMLQHPQILQDTINQGHDIAVHTWTHPQMTTLSNMDILGQLGWSVELFRNSTGGKIPKYWRPPTGDSDERVRAIAKEIFGLTAVIWNHDTEDWSLTAQPPGTTTEWIHNNFTQWLAGPKSPGMIVLEHVLSPGSVQAFIDAYPLMKAAGWKTKSTIQLIGNGNAFQSGSGSVIANPSQVTTTGSSSSAASKTPANLVSPSVPPSTSKSTSSTSGSAVAPTASKNGADSVPARILGSASVVALSYLLSFLL